MSLQEGIPEHPCLSSSPFDAKNPFLAQVTENRKLNEGGERHLMHLELDISNSKIRYFPGRTGDCFSVLSGAKSKGVAPASSSISEGSLTPYHCPFGLLCQVPPASTCSQLLQCFGFIPSHVPDLLEQSQWQELSRSHSINERAAEL